MTLNEMQQKCVCWGLGEPMTRFSNESAPLRVGVGPVHAARLHSTTSYGLNEASHQPLLFCRSTAGMGQRQQCFVMR